GIAALLVQVYSGHTPQEILKSNEDFIAKIGLQEFLSPTRANGLLAMIKQIKFYAIAFDAKNA
ncbi:SufE family protein, partial [Ornithobacterium rhinotracheale]